MWLLAIAAPLAGQNLTLSPSTPQLPLATIGVSYNQVFTVTGGTTPYTWTVPNTLSGTGLSFIVGGSGNSTLTLSGSPAFTAAGTYTLSITATESPTANPRRQAQATYTLVIGSPITITNSTNLPSGTQGVAYGPVTLVASGGTGAGYTFSLASGALPAGVTLNGANISGVPAAAGSFNFGVTVTDSGSNSTTKSFTIPIAPALIITTSSIPSGSVGVSYNALIEANGGSGTRTWSASGLPAGLAIAPASGQITGTPTAAGSFNVTISVSDSSGTATKQLTLTIAGSTLSITTATLPAGAVGVAYSFTMTASGGSGTRTWSATGLPGGLSMSTAGAIGGTPTAAGSFNVTASVSDSSTSTPVTKQFTLTIAAALAITTPSLPGGSVGVAYSATVEAAGGSGTRSWSATGLPAGLAIDATSGVISGTPTAAGSFTPSITVTDSTGPVTRQFTIAIGGGLTITTAALPQGTAGSAYPSTTIEASGGSGTRTWSASGLPAGMTIAAGTGVLSGTPTAGGTFTVTINVTDTAGGNASKQFSLLVAAGITITTTSLPAGAQGVAYSATVEATGGSGTRTWSASGLPTGLSIVPSTGVIGGTPTTNGGFTVTITVTDSSGTTSKQLTLAIAAGLVITTQSLPNGTLGSPYTALVEATGGSGTRNWSATGLPQGLSINSSGVISGTPQSAGTFPISIGVSDITGTANKQLTLTISAGLTISTSSLPGGTVNVAYSFSVVATGGTGNYTFSASGLPAGLTIASNNGLIAGTPTANGTFPITVQVSDGVTTVSKQLSLTIVVGINITTSSLPGGAVGQAYTAQLQASGAPSAVTWSIASGSLPPGLALAAPTGIISGSPTTAGTFTFIVQAVDATSTSTTKQLSIAIGQALVITTQSLPTATAGVAYSATVEATGGSGTRSWSATGLPAGLSLNASTGQITGTATAAGTAQVSISVTDGITTVSKQFTLTVSTGLSITTQSLPQARVGAAYSATLQASGGATSNYSWSGTGLPPGLVVAASGIISGTPTTAGSYNPSITVSDGVASVSKVLPIAVTVALSISTTTLPNGAVGLAYNARVEAAGATTVSWRVTSGALPPGLALAGGTGVISGTPIARSGGSYSFTIEATDGATTSTLPYTITILEIVTTVLPVPTLGQGYSAQLAASGVSGHTWSLLSGQLPTGLVLQPTGLITGTPSTAGVFNFVIQVSWQGLTTQQGYALTIGGSGTVSIVTTTLPAGSAGVAYSAGLQATGGSGAYTWQLISGQLPPGVAMSAAGVLSGTPAENGSYTFTVRVFDSANTSLADQKQFTIGIGTSGFTITTGTLASATVGTSYSVTLTAAGGTQPYTWTVSAGQLPFGIGLTPNSGLLSGTPLVPGTYTFTVRATDALGQAASRQLSLVVNPGLTITTTSLPGGSVGQPYSTLLTVSGGSGASYVWSITAGQLPGGLTLTPQAGLISGTPQANGSFPITIQVADSLGGSTSKAFTLTIGTALSITTATLPNASTNVPYSQSVSAAGGTPPLQWSVIAGLLPPGLQLNAGTGQVTGTATTVGPYTFTIQVRDSSQQVASRQFGMLVTEGLSIVTASLPAATEGLSYTQTLTAAGGTPPYSWTIAVGSLPRGLTLNSNGSISGIPAEPSNFSFIVQVSDAGQQAVTKAFTLVVNTRTAFVIATALTLPAAQVQTPYSIRFQAQGGAPPYVWSLGTGAALPVGLTLDPEGTLSGSPTSAGNFNFAVRVIDSQGLSASQTFALSVNPGLAITTPSPLPAATAGSPYTATLGAAGGQPDFRYSLAGGALPAGLTLSPGGVIAGTPAAVGTFSFDVQVTDAAGATARAGFTLAVRLPGSPTVTITGLGENVEPAQQPRINVNLGAPYPVAVTGTITMTFTPDAVVPADDPAVVFANGRRTAAFTVDAGATQARFADGGGILQTGTVAGTIDLTVRLDASGADITPSPAPRQTARVNRAAPVLRTVRARRVTGGLEVEITGFATSRELSQAVFRFTPIPGSALQTTELTVPLSTGARGWYESEESRRFGSQFTLTQQFNVQGDTSAIGSVTVTISNAQGTSSPAAGSF